MAPLFLHPIHRVRIVKLGVFDPSELRFLGVNIRPDKGKFPSFWTRASLSRRLLLRGLDVEVSRDRVADTWRFRMTRFGAHDSRQEFVQGWGSGTLMFTGAGHKA